MMKKLDINQVAEFIRAQTPETKIYLGCDSERVKIDGAWHADYDFEGSNISVLLDILAFNTYQNAFYLNMIGNEMFLDTATLRDSVISHAKELNYLPRSYTSAAATVRVNVNVTNNSIYSITVPQYYKFTATTSNGTYTFSTAEPYVINRNANNQFVRNIDIYEGVLLTDL